MAAFLLMNLTSNFSTNKLTTNERGRGVQREYFEYLSHGRLAYNNAWAKVSKMTCFLRITNIYQHVKCSVFTEIIFIRH
jgi:hypothetical protein